jgi:myo-inositol catabolism protein IolC
MSDTGIHPIYLLAFDHRGSFQSKLLGIAGDPTPTDAARIREAKAIIFAGFRKALESGLSTDGAGILVDEQYGADLARAARELGVVLAMPVEKSGQVEFDFQYGERFGDHIEEFQPTYAKVLVRYNVGGDAELNRRQAARLARLGGWLKDSDSDFLFELLVPPEPHQLEALGGDGERYDHELRPHLMARALEELQGAGVEPDIWKLEGLDSRDDCAQLAEIARRGGRDGVECVVLGRGGDEAKVEHWLRTGSGVSGWVGFAVGRTIWWDPLEEWLAGASAEEAAERIGANYAQLVGAYAESGQARA